MTIGPGESYTYTLDPREVGVLVDPTTDLRHVRVSGRITAVVSDPGDPSHPQPALLIELTARFDPGAGAGGVRTIASGGTWRFLPSALDRTAGEVRLTSGEGQTSAALAGVSLVHRMRRPERHPGAQAHWVYIRR